MAIIGVVERYNELLSYLLKHYKLIKVNIDSLVFSPGHIILTPLELSIGSGKIDVIDMNLLDFLTGEVTVCAYFDILDASQSIIEKVKQKLLEDGWLNKMFKLGYFNKLFIDDYCWCPSYYKCPMCLAVDAKFTLPNFKLFLNLLEKMREEAKILGIAESMKK